MNRQQRRAAAKTNDAATLCAAGTALKRAGKIEDAIAHYRKAVAIAPDFAEAHNNLGNLLKQAGRLEEAINHFHRALALAPGLGEVHNNLGNALQEQGHTHEALAHLRQAVARAPGSAEAHNNLGSVLHGLGEWADAVAHYEQALRLKPDYPDACINLGLALADMGQRAQALAAAGIAARLSSQPAFPHFLLGVLLARCDCAEGARVCLINYLRQEPDDRRGARLLLARLGFEALPERAPNLLLERLYATRAASWDRGAGGPQAYRGAELVAQALVRFAGDGRDLDIADLGCGTGLVGALVRQRARSLVGVDMSAPMLVRAKDKRIYDDLQQTDLVSFLDGHAGRFDILTCAATLIHFGDLRPVFAAAAPCLRGGGLFVFTLFPDDENADGYALGSLDGLAQGGCYAHGEGYVQRLAAACGFAVESLERQIHEYVHGAPRMGLLVVLRRHADIGRAARMNEMASAQSRGEP